jgi:hypothetical protein
VLSWCSPAVRVGQDLASTDYGGMDIASPDSVQHQLHRSMLKGGRTAVEARVAQLRDQILADAGNLMDYGQKVRARLPAHHGLAGRPPTLPASPRDGASLAVGSRLTRGPAQVGKVKPPAGIAKLS